MFFFGVLLHFLRQGAIFVRTAIVWLLSSEEGRSVARPARLMLFTNISDSVFFAYLFLDTSGVSWSCMACLTFRDVQVGGTRTEGGEVALIFTVSSCPMIAVVPVRRSRPLQTFGCHQHSLCSRQFNRKFTSASLRG